MAGDATPVTVARDYEAFDVNEPPGWQSPGKRRAPWVAAILGCVWAAAAAAQTAETAILNFWDPHSHAERPAAGAIKAIRFATTDDFPPFSFTGADGRLVGFNVDL